MKIQNHLKKSKMFSILTHQKSEKNGKKIESRRKNTPEIENKGKIPDDDNTGINKVKSDTLMKAKDVHQIGGSLLSSESTDLSSVNSPPLPSD